MVKNNTFCCVKSAKEGQKLSDILRDFKKFTSVKIIEGIKNNIYESRKAWMLGFQSGQI